MTAVAPGVRSAPAPRTRADAAPGVRDRSIDFLRALCVVVVVLIHAQMVGVTAGPEGVVFFDASEGTNWLIPFSWAIQVMPLFFLIGGFSGYLAYQRLRARGGRTSGFLAGRVHRLLLPAVVTLAVIGALLMLLSALGLPEDFIATARYRFGQPLWFLATFLMCQALLPALARAHDRAPWWTLGALVAAAGSVDLARGLTGIDAIGFLNLAFVWLAIQQLGFFFAQGRVDRLPRAVRAIAAAVGVAAVAVSVLLGVYSADLLYNLNPPTTILIISGVAQLFLVSLARPLVARLADRRGARAFTAFVTPRAMTSYLWHMPVLLAMAGILAVGALLTGIDLPAPSSPAWWLIRPLWLLAALALTALIAWALAPLEQRPLPGGVPSLTRSIVASALGAAGLLLILVASESVPALFVGAALALFALRTARTRTSGVR